MKRILFYSEAWGKGGIEAFIKSVLPALTAHGYEADVFSTWDWADCDDTELASLGVRRFVRFQGYRPGQITRLVQGPKAFRQCLQKTNYDAVWINAMNGMGFRFSREAAAAGVPMRIVHSHNTDVGEGAKKLKRLIGRIGMLLWSNTATHNIACSLEAGKYLFRDGSFEILENGIDVERSRYSDEKRCCARKELGISEDVLLIGNIGRISSQKNPLFQIQIFAEFLKLHPDAKYLMLGRPDMREQVVDLARKLNCLDSLVIHAPVEDSSMYFCALDAFLMPSLYEGFGIVKVEAQCSGCPVLSGAHLPSAANITDLVSVCDLKGDLSVWAAKLEKLVSYSKEKRRDCYADLVSESGFSIEQTVHKIIALLQ